MSAFYKFTNQPACCAIVLLALVACSSSNGPEGGAPSAAGAAAVGGTSSASGATAVSGASAAGTESGGGADAGGASGGATAGSAGVGGSSGGGAGASSGGASGAAGASGSGGAGGGLAACNLAHQKGVAQLTLMSGGLMRKVRLFVPQAYDGSKPLPLLLNLHGSTDVADHFASVSQMEQVADSEGFVVAGLEAVAGAWNVPPASGMPDDVKYAADAIDLAAATLCIDTTRVYASGFSGGGRMSSRLGCEIPDRITAIGPVAGVRWPAPCAGRPVPVIAIHGLADGTNVYAGEGAGHPRWNESVEDAVLGWATKNGCNLSRQVDDPAGPISTYSYGQCQGGARVKLVRMDGVDHAYPTGTPLHAAKEVWSFVKQFARQ